MVESSIYTELFPWSSQRPVPRAPKLVRPCQLCCHCSSDSTCAAIFTTELGDATLEKEGGAEASFDGICLSLCTLGNFIT